MNEQKIKSGCCSLKNIINNKMTATGGLTGFVVINSIITITLIIGLVIALFKINVAKYAIPSLKKEYS